MEGDFPQPTVQEKRRMSLTVWVFTSRIASVVVVMIAWIRKTVLPVQVTDDEVIRASSAPPSGSGLQRVQGGVPRNGAKTVACYCFCVVVSVVSCADFAGSQPSGVPTRNFFLSHWAILHERMATHSSLSQLWSLYCLVHILLRRYSTDFFDELTRLSWFSLWWIVANRRTGSSLEPSKTIYKKACHGGMCLFMVLPMRVLAVVQTMRNSS
jgi:hypothetical protein